MGGLAWCIQQQTRDPASNKVGVKDQHWKLSLDLFAGMPTLTLLPHTPTEDLERKENVFVSLASLQLAVPWGFPLVR